MTRMTYVRLLLARLSICLGAATFAFAANAQSKDAKDAKETKATADAPEGKDAENADEAAATPDRMMHTDGYVHTWLRMPGFQGENLRSGDTLIFAPRKGEMNVLIFVASWCEPCQRLIPDVQRLERRFAGLNTRFIYIFAHDTAADAEGFMKEYKLSSAVLANREILSAYNNPELPSIYVGDRRQWLLTRFINTKEKDLATLGKIVEGAVSW